MATIDFAKIRSEPRSQNDGFESLAVELFRSSFRAIAGSTFISLRGDGGDGGVEAYFRSPDGTLVGVQAKYFFQLRDAELRQIADSLDTALKNHPTLSEYWVYIPFDLTGRVAAGRRGRSQAERFEHWKQAVEASPTPNGTRLVVTLCTAAVIRQQLLKCDPNGGLRRYWFDDSVLTRTQLEQCLADAVAFAGPRYTAALDVVTRAHIGLDFFGGIGDFEAWREKSLAPVVSEIRSLTGLGDTAFDILGEHDATAARQLLGQVLLECGRIIDVASFASHATAVKNGLERILPMLSKAREAQEQAFYDKHGREMDTPSFRHFHAEYMCAFPAGEMDAARKLEKQTRALEDVLSAPEMGAVTARSLLLVGPAGIGKTHSLVSAARRRLAHGGSSLVVFGDDFGRNEPWEVIRSKLGFGADVARGTLFECLQACAENTALPFVIYIDALNESPRAARWKDKLPEFVAQCAPYSGVRVCVSTRDTYRDLVVDARFPGYAFEHTGFAGRETEAVEAFATHYGLDAEITPLFSPELGNPLFLHLACKTLRDEGRTSLDISLPGFVALLDSHLAHCDALIRGRLAYSNPRNVVRAAMLRLSEVLTLNVPKKRTWEVCISELKDLAGTEILPEALLNELEHEGLVILSEGESDAWFVRLGYQRYGDILRATSVVEGLIGPAGLDVPTLASKLATLTADDKGLLEALAAVLPEKSGVEITDRRLGIEPALAYQLFVRALVWRSRESVTYDIDDHVNGALYTPNLWQEVYESLFRVSLVPNHRLNASNWLSPFLRKSPLVDRDAYLSVAAFRSYDAKGAVWSLINASLRADVRRWPCESRQLAVIALAWLTSCTDRRVRDLSAKAMVRLIAFQPALGKALTDEFFDCDDDYILESVALAIYSASLLERDRSSEFVPVLEGLLIPAFDTPNVLVRDSVRLLGKLVDRSALCTSAQKMLDAYPSKTPLFTIWPTPFDAQALLNLEGLPFNMQLGGKGLQPDFWRYQVEPRISAFDLDNAGITNENLACWLMVEVLRLGYPGHKQCALTQDLAITSVFGNGRARDGYAERLGKKYYWILFHRLLGMLADNVPPKISYSGCSVSPAHLWSIDVRKADLTDVRDISQLPEYPDEVVQGPRYPFPERSSDIKSWARTDDFTPHGACIVRTSNMGIEWVSLSLSAGDTDRPPEDDSWNQPHLSVDLLYTSIFFEGHVPNFDLDDTGRDVFESQGAMSYRGYLAEYPNGPAFEQLEDEGDLYRGPTGMEFSEVALLRDGEWQYDFSYSAAERPAHLHVPCADLIRVLGLTWDRQRGWLDRTGALIAFESRAMRRRGLFIRRDALNAYLSITMRTLVYRRFANRGLRAGGDVDGMQMDMFSWLSYELTTAPTVLNVVKRPFNC